MQPSSGFGLVYSIPKSGGTPSLLATNAQINRGSVVVDSTYVYFMTYAPGDGGYDGQIRAVPKTGIGDAGAPMVVATFPQTELQGLIAGTDGLYVTEGSQIWRVPFGIASSTPVLLFNGTALGGLAFMTTDNTSLFWADQVDGAVYKMPIAGGYAQRIALNLFEPFIALADANNVYFQASGGTGTFLSMPTAYDP